MIPLYHDFSDETVLVFGGGPVGARKARRFAEEARVVVVSPAFADRAFGDAELVREAPDAEGVRGWVARVGPALVVAATDDPDLNAAAAAAARAAGALVNRADRSGSDRDVDSVVVPATVEDGSVSVAISTGGASPALAKHLREQIEADIADAGAMAELTADLRSELKTRDMTAEERRDAVRAVVRSPSVWKGLRRGESKARREAQRVIRNTVGGDSS
ncbi:precorrin-2 dehydrogenase/sirohydrochlorin ferrochelatase family protein [Salinirubrum litoreum]|uniref:precorrin-2 dehydrogenase n=1 Tax=Salinirubrum litoreum TaxID=1126234 RepID=A0ABD5R9R3_9EURY